MKSASMIGIVPTVGALTLLVMSGAAGQVKDQIALEKEGIQLIKQLEDVAEEVKYHAEHLETFSRNMMVSPYTHSHHLADVKELVNGGLRPALTRLSEIQPKLPDWKQQSIDKMLIAARDLAADTNSAILANKSLDRVPPPMNATYKELLARIVRHADSLVKTSDAAASYAEAHMKAAEAGLATSLSATKK